MSGVGRLAASGEPGLFGGRSLSWALDSVVRVVALVCLGGLAGCQPTATSPSAQSPPTRSANPAASSTKTASAADLETPARIKVRVAAASDLRFVFDELAQAFGALEPTIQLEPTFGASGSFFAQLTNEAPFDLFLSADIALARKLIEQGQGVEGSEFEFADGQLAIWVRPDSPLPVETEGISVVRRPEARKIAIANPEHAPYGRAAVASLKSLLLYDQVQDRLVLAENVAQALQFVDSGAADVGIVATALVRAPAMESKGRSGPVPVLSYPPLVQGGVILKWATDPVAANKFCEFLYSEPGRLILERYGLGRELR